MAAQDELTKKSAEELQSQNHLNVEISKNTMKNDCQATDKAYVVCFDLEQQFSLPNLTHSQMYYSRQLTAYNLGIHDEIRRKGVMCLWTEDHISRPNKHIFGKKEFY